MDLSRLRPVTDVSVGAWIAPRLEPLGPWVGSIVPRGFEAYVRVLHPITRRNDVPVSWAEVCAVSGHEPHALMAWDDIVGVIEARVDQTPVRTPAWPGEEPEEGNLGSRGLRALCHLLALHTEAGRCFFALWDGYGWVHGSPAVGVLRVEPTSWMARLTRRLRRADDSVPPGLPEEAVTAPRLRHPGREYLLFQGPVQAATDMGWQADDDFFLPQSPNLFWPADQAWCVATDVDLRSTLIGGSTPLIAAILGDVELEAWPIGPDDSVD